MNRPHAPANYRQLPLTPEQLREVEHYIHVRERAGVAWDTPELAHMLDDMLNPPATLEDEQLFLEQSFAAERSVAQNEESDQLDLLKSERDRNH